MRFLHIQRLSFFSLLFVFNFSVAGLAPLPPLPPLSKPVPPPSLSVDSAPLPPPPAVASAVVVDRSVVSAVMVDSVDEKLAGGMGDARQDDPAKNASAQKAMMSLADIEKLVSQFHSLEESVDSNYAAFDKKLDGSFQDIFSTLGRVSSLIDGITAALAEKDGDLSAALDEASKMIAALKALQISFDKDEDAVRQSLVDFKKKRTDFSAQYSKASSLKNDILVQAGDGKKQVDQIAEIFTKTQSLYDQASSKEAPDILSSIKKIQDGVAKTVADIAALNAQAEKVKKLFASNKKKQKPDLVTQDSLPYKKTLADVVQKKENLPLSSSNDGASKNMALEVVGTIGQGVKSVWIGFVKAFQSIREKRIAALAPEEAAAEAKVLHEKKSGLKVAAQGFVAGSWLLGVSAFAYLKQVFAQLALRSARVAGAAIVSAQTPVSAAETPPALKTSSVDGV